MTRDVTREGSGSTSELSSSGARRVSHLVFGQVLAVLVIGLGIGWLTGLAASPVVSGVITSLLGLVGGVFVAVPLTEKARSSPAWNDARPAALLVLGVALGATLGVAARTHDLLSPPQPQAQIGEIKAANSESIHASVLFSQPGGSECAELLTARPEALPVLFRSSSREAMRLLGKRIDNPSLLQEIARAVCED